MRYEWTDALSRATCYIEIEAPPGRLPLACEILRLTGAYDRLLSEAKNDAHLAEVARDLAAERIAALEEENRRLLAENDRLRLLIGDREERERRARAANDRLAEAADL